MHLSIRSCAAGAVLGFFGLTANVTAQTSPPSTIQPAVVTGSTQIPTYSAAVVSLSNPAASDLYCVGGSATKTVKIKGIRVSAVASAAIVGDVSIILRMAANSGGGA